MNFDYELDVSSNNSYGTWDKETQSWSGIVGDLIRGDIDISVATLTMNTEREEVIDFVAPYFDQSGISILLRQEEEVQSIFKFVNVLKYEVSSLLMTYYNLCVCLRNEYRSRDNNRTNLQ